MKKQILILASILLYNFSFSQKTVDGYPLDVLIGTYFGHKVDFENGKVDATKDYKITINPDFTFSIATKINGNWRQLISEKMIAKNAEIDKNIKGVAYDFEIPNSSDYRIISIGMFNNELTSIFKKGVLFTLIEKGSDHSLTYVMDKEGGNPSPQKVTPPPTKYKKKKKRSDTNNGINYAAGYGRSKYSLTDINTVLQRYNETNANILEEGMGEIPFFQGLFSELDYYNEGFFGAFNVTWEVGNTKATGVDNFGEMRDYHFQIRHLRFGGQIGLIRHPRNFFKWAIGGTISGGRYRFFTTTSAVGKKLNDLNFGDKITTEDPKTMHVGGFVRVVLGDFRREQAQRFRLFLQADYLTQINGSNLLMINEALNPTSFMNDDNENLNMKTSFLGLKIGLMIGLVEDM